MFLKKMTLSACDSNGNVDKEIEPFELMLNPETVTVKSAICYTKQEGSGSGKNNPPKYSYQPLKQIDIAPFIIDVTGAIPGTMGLLHADMVEVIDHLEDVVYNITDDDKPPTILVEWGKTSYKTQLTSMDVKYTLFDSDGEPLRAEITLNLQEFPDDSHPSFGPTLSEDNVQVIIVEDGQTLPGLCQKVYGDPSLYQKVAEYNELDSFYSLEPGQPLLFPHFND